MKSFKIIITVALSVLISACSEPQPKLSQAYHEKWAQELDKLNVDKLRICRSHVRYEATSTTLSCIINWGRYRFLFHHDGAGVMTGTVIEKSDGQWIVHASDGIEKKISFNDAIGVLNKATQTLVIRMNKEKQIKQRRKATWETDRSTE